jgi:peptidoglycan lytic transglycosylase
MLMATLRQGTPAPAPSRVLVASAGPFVPGFGEADDSGPLPLPAERPFGLGGGPVASPQAGTGPAKQVRSAVRLPTPAVPARSPDLVAAAPISAYAPVSGDGSAGLLSGRGLY